MIHQVLLVEIATGEERDAQGPDPSRCDVIGRRAFPLRYGRNVTVCARVERCTAAIEKREPAADRRLLHSGRCAQSARHLFGETRTGSDIRILRLGRDGESDPEITSLEAGVLLTQPHKTRDNQRRPGDQGNRKRNLRPDQQFAETLLADAAGGATPPFLQRIDDVPARALQRRIQAHDQAGQQRESDREREHWERESSRSVGFDRQEVRRQFRHERDQLPRQKRAQNAGDQTDEHAFENEKAQHAGPRRAQRHPEGNLAPPAAESNEKQIGDVAARDEQNKGHGREERGEPRPEIFRYVLWQRLHHGAGFRVDLFGILRTIAVLEQLQGSEGLLFRSAGLQATDRTQEGGPPHHPLMRETRDDERFGRPDIGIGPRP